MANTNGGGPTPVWQASRFENILILLMHKLKCEITETKLSENCRLACHKVTGE